MNLDDVSAFAKIDTQDMISEIDGLPDQLLAAWDLGKNLSLPDWDGIQHVLVSGMGGSAIGADLVRAYVSPACPVPVITQRNYGLPAWAKGPETLVIASSHSGNTEETLSTYDKAVERGCRMLAVTTGGKLAQAAQKNGVPLWRFEHQGQPRAAVGYSFGLLLAILHHLGLVPDAQEELDTAVSAMRAQQESLRAEVPVVENPAKRMAGQLFGRWVAVLGADILAPVARRWKGQISEIAKAWGQFEFLPESDHNTLAGLYNPEGALSNTFVLFLRAASYHPRNQLRTELTKKAFMLEGLNTDFIDAQGETSLAHLWTALHFGDYTAYYLAMAYGVDPTPVEAIESFKQEMRQAG
ncbi:MAG TPA: bifunctional phosphoglucose/phosphomannose isomerase [Anaerolineales bacterium]|jgi:glucose/mannose-6-phosphate isomerase|nr:bifunctional phosphoglucose/phosphomannose isomerase [Anaerolineales bacterium]